MKASVVSPANIALIKHWGLQYSDPYPTPLAGSISFNLSHCTTHTTVEWRDGLHDEIWLSGTPLTPQNNPRAHAALAIMQAARTALSLTGKTALVHTQNSFPTGAGIASSASGFSALAGASLAAGGIDISTSKGQQQVVDICAHGGSVSALRSIVDGWGRVDFVPEMGAYRVQSLATADHWNLVDLVVVLNNKPKAHGSADGHRVAASSPQQQARLTHVRQHLADFDTLLQQRNFAAIGSLSEHEAQLMLGVMQTTTPPISYATADSWRIIKAAEQLQQEDTDVFWTIDAGANPHIITTAAQAAGIKQHLESLSGVQRVIANTPCAGTHAVSEHLF